MGEKNKPTAAGRATLFIFLKQQTIFYLHYSLENYYGTNNNL